MASGEEPLTTHVSHLEPVLSDWIGPALADTRQGLVCLPEADPPALYLVDGDPSARPAKPNRHPYPG